MWWYMYWLILMLVFLFHDARAELPPVHTDFKTPYGDVSVWGSFGQGYVWNDRYSFFGSEDDPFGYREISLGGQYRFWDNYSVTIQGEYRDAGESDNLGLRLGQAFLEGNFRTGEDTILGANLGRVEVPFGLYNRTRDRVDTRPSIVLPQSVYLEGLGVRDFILNGDGAMGYGLHQITPESRIESRIAVVQPAFGEVDSPLVSGWVGYNWDEKLKLRFTLLYTEQEESQLSFPVLSGQFLWDRWAFTSEWGRLKLDSTFGSVDSNGVYGQVEYEITPDLVLVGRYDYLKLDLDTPVPFDIPDDLLRSQSLMFGFGYDITKNWRLDAEYHLVDGKVFLNGAENPGLVEGPEEWDILLLMASFRF